MDEKKRDQQSDRFKGQQQPGAQRPSSHQPDEQKRHEPQTQNPNREPVDDPRNMPDDQSER
jgi:hypothetical protein